jgi:outer membrane protein assembly factor BamB
MRYAVKVKVQFNVLLLGAVMKRTALASTLILTLLFSMLAGTLFFDVRGAKKPCSPPLSYFDASTISSATSDNEAETGSPELSATELWNFTVANSTANTLSVNWRKPNVANGIAYLCNTEWYIIPGEPHVPLLDIPVIHQLGTTYAINITSGEELWNLTGTGHLVSFALSDGVGYMSTSDPRFINEQSAGASFYALDAINGSLKWSRPFDGDIMWSTIEEGVLYVFFVASGFNTYVYAMNASTAYPLWNWKAGYYNLLSPLAISDDVIYFGSGYPDRHFYAVSVTNGSDLWRVPVEGEVSARSSVVDGVVYFNTDKATCALNAKNGEKLWNYTVSSYNPCIVDGGIAYIREADDIIHALNASDGNIVWNYSANEAISSLCIVDNILYFSSNETLNAWNAANGEQLWNSSIISEAPLIITEGSSGYYSSFSATISDGVLYYYSDETLHVLDASNGSSLWNYTRSDQSFLTVADGTAFFAAGNTVYALNVPSAVNPSSPEPQQDAFLTTIVAAAAVSATVVGLVLLAYYKKRKHQSLN